MFFGHRNDVMNLSVLGQNSKTCNTITLPQHSMPQPRSAVLAPQTHYGTDSHIEPCEALLVCSTHSIKKQDAPYRTFCSFHLISIQCPSCMQLCSRLPSQRLNMLLDGFSGLQEAANVCRAAAAVSDRMGLSCVCVCCRTGSGVRRYVGRCWFQPGTTFPVSHDLPEHSPLLPQLQQSARPPSLPCSCQACEPDMATHNAIN